MNNELLKTCPACGNDTMSENKCTSCNILVRYIDCSHDNLSLEDIVKDDLTQQMIAKGKEAGEYYIFHK